METISDDTVEALANEGTKLAHAKLEIAALREVLMACVRTELFFADHPQRQKAYKAAREILS